MFMSIDQIFNFGTAGESQRLFYFVNSTDVSVDQDSGVGASFYDSKIGRAFRTDDRKNGWTDFFHFRFHYKFAYPSRIQVAS